MIFAASGWPGGFAYPGPGNGHCGKGAAATMSSAATARKRIINRNSAAPSRPGQERPSRNPCPGRAEKKQARPFEKKKQKLFPPPLAATLPLSRTGWVGCSSAPHPPRSSPNPPPTSQNPFRQQQTPARIPASPSAQFAADLTTSARMPSQPRQTTTTIPPPIPRQPNPPHHPNAPVQPPRSCYPNAPNAFGTAWGSRACQPTYVCVPSPPPPPSRSR